MQKTLLYPHERFIPLNNVHVMNLVAGSPSNERVVLILSLLFSNVEGDLDDELDTRLRQTKNLG
jgi:hypothetical protein